MLHITPSIGICMYPDDGGDVETLMRNADAAMYHAKANGRNNYQFFTAAHEPGRGAAISSSRAACAARSAQGEFELFYQPIIDIADAPRACAWRCCCAGAVPSTAWCCRTTSSRSLEENGLIVPIGEWVMRAACEQSVAWQRAGLQPVPLAVNLSPRQFMHRGAGRIDPAHRSTRPGSIRRCSNSRSPRPR